MVLSIREYALAKKGRKVEAEVEVHRNVWNIWNILYIW